MSGGPRLALPVGSRLAERDGDAVEHARLLLDDVLGRAAPDRENVHPRDHHGDEHHPRHRLEPGEEPEAERDERRELGEVEGDVELGEVQQHGECGEREPDRKQAARPLQRQHEPDERERRR